MTTKLLILIKHSLPEVLSDVPARDWELSEEGRERARELAGKLSIYHPEIIISSIEPKARETAQILSENLELEFMEAGGLHEHGRSQSPYYSKNNFQHLVQEFFRKPDVLVFGKETASQALERFRQALGSVLDDNKGKTTALVAHGTVISLFVAWLTGCDGYQLWSELGLPSFVVLDVQSKLLLKIENLP